MRRTLEALGSLAFVFGAALTLILVLLVLDRRSPSRRPAVPRLRLVSGGR